MKIYGLLSLAAFLMLSAAAVWLGGLNQDEGWYLYAAQLVGEGQVPYRDFFYTQGPIMPVVYSVFAWVWRNWGLLGARILTSLIGGVGIVFAVALARRLAPTEHRTAVGVAVSLLLGSNLYHLYYTSIPKTYALAGAFVAAGFFLLAVALDAPRRRGAMLLVASGLSLALAAGTRISLGALVAVVGIGLLVRVRYRGLAFLWFGIGASLGLLLVYAPFLLDSAAREGLFAAQAYHAARGGFDIVWTVGSLSRLVRWYLPVFLLLGMGVFGRTMPKRGEDVLLLTGLGFAAVFAVQMLAPFPYEDYQVPVMGLLAVFAAVSFFKGITAERSSHAVLLVLGACWALSFGSPLLEKWSTDGQDRFWSVKKDKSELAQLRCVADKIEALDPGGRDIFTQDLYLAIETRRRVPKGLEMGPFAMLSDAEWRSLIESASCEIAAVSGYGFSIEPPSCRERSVEKQREYRGLLRRHYGLAFTEKRFGQNSTTLVVLKRKRGK